MAAQPKQPERASASAKRATAWRALERGFDIVVVGGGITGAGVAREAARRGLKVALFEKLDLASGTSSRSSKLVHGGLRYLEHYEFALVFESVSERRVLQSIAPHLVRPLGFLFPVWEGARRGLWTIRAGMWLYEGLSLFRSPKRPRTLSQGDVGREEPALDSGGLKGASLYWDCHTNDARLTLETVQDAAQHGAVVLNWASVDSVRRDATGRVCGVTVTDGLGKAGTVTVDARVVVSCTGPWTDGALAQGGAPRAPLLRPTKGVHIVLAPGRLRLRHAVVCVHPRDGRVLFAIPWGDAAYAGTTDTFVEGADPGAVFADSDDVDYLLEALHDHFPSAALTRDDVTATWAGLRPLVAPNETGVAASSMSREHVVRVESDGLVVVAGGKLTTYRRMASEVVDAAVSWMHLAGMAPMTQPARTDTEPLPGAVGWPEDDRVEDIVAELASQVDREVAEHLVATYGMVARDVVGQLAVHPGAHARLVPGRPEVEAEVHHAVDGEFAQRVEDILLRRLNLYYLDVDQGLGAVERVADLLASRLGWTEARRADEVLRYRTLVASSRSWRK